MSYKETIESFIYDYPILEFHYLDRKDLIFSEKVRFLCEHECEHYGHSWACPPAIGSIETFGLVFVLEAADAMCKAADVELIGYENVASGYISVLVRGDVGACKTAVDAGVKAVEAMGAEVYSSVVIPRPHPDLEKIITRYSLKNLLPAESGKEA